MECHTPDSISHHDFTGGLGKGGQKFLGPWGESISRNITSHKEKGIGAWSDAEIKRAITQGIRPDGAGSSRRWGCLVCAPNGEVLPPSSPTCAPCRRRVTAPSS
jgi:hypothetical protein